MKTKIQFVLWLFTSCLSQPTLSTQLNVIGVPDCGKWVSYKSQPDRGWILGFMSGLSYARIDNMGGKNVLEFVTADQIFLWMTNFCQQSPLSTVADGGNELYKELLKKNRSQ